MEDFENLLRKCIAQQEAPIPVFEVTLNEDQPLYVSCRSKQATSRGNVLTLNGLFGNKLGLKDKDEVIIRPLSNIPICIQVSIEPMSVDDWEILERSAAFVESNLMDQIRVVWRGLVFPVWIEKSICIFLKVGITEPSAPCVILTNETEVIVSPKLRKDIVSHKTTPAASAIKKPNYFPEEELDDNKLQHNGEEEGSHRKTSKEKISPSRWHWKDWLPWLPGYQQMTDSMEKSMPDIDPSVIKSERRLSIDKPKSSLQHGVNLKFRVQSLKTNFGKKMEELDGDDDETDICWSLQDSTTVFVNREDIVEQLEENCPTIPEIFLAKVKKLLTPKLQIIEMEKEMKKKDVEHDKSGNKKNADKTDEKKKKESEGDKSIEAVVKVVVIDKRREMSDPKLEEIVCAVLNDQQSLRGHVIIPCLLRRLLKLDVTSPVWLQVTEEVPDCPSKYELYPVGSLPMSVTTQMVQMAFKNWVKLISTKKIPLIIFNGVAVKFPVFREVHMEFQIVLADSDVIKPDVSYPFGVMHPGNLNEVPIHVIQNTHNSSEQKQKPKWPIQAMLQYTDVKSIDPLVPTTQLENLGDIDQYTKDALHHIEVCLGTRPVADSMFRLKSPGLHNGILLISGPKGCGKSSFARGLCRKVAEPPNLAYVHVVDCKALRSKRPDYIHKLIEETFEEAAWRQPSVILLDDLDHVAPAPTGPEAELSGEAVYGARVGEVFKDVFRKEIRNCSRIAIIAVCDSRSTVHPLLVNTRGTHFVQEFMCITPPDKDGRKKILETIIYNRPYLSPDTIHKLDWDEIRSKTEGYVASDLESLVSRALHAHCIKHDEREQEVVLFDEDFKHALCGFTPASIRNVPLHTAGELGWEDVGGLTEVKSILQETLLWPSKYPELFANCPLRLRSGILLYGAPGTGKTLLAGVVARECGLNFISIKGPELLSKYIGASEQAVRDNFMRAQSAKPCILFFDEFDSLAPRRGHDNTGVTDRVVNQLLTQLDGVEGLQGVYVLAATSRPDLIDPALLRPGRLDKCVKCEIPTQEERLRIFESQTQKMTIGPDVDFKYFAEKCEHFTGADIKAFLYNAQLEAIHEVTGKIKKDLTNPNSSSGSSNSYSRTPKKIRSPRKMPSCPTLKKGATIDASDSNKKVLYVPKLEDGIVQISEEMEEKLVSQVEHIQARLMVKKSSEHISTSENLFSPIATSKPQLIQVRQRHMLAALDKTRPSVSLEERNRYKRIYENFLSSRGGNFGEVPKDSTMRQTLA